MQPRAATCSQVQPGAARCSALDGYLSLSQFPSAGRVHLLLHHQLSPTVTLLCSQLWLRSSLWGLCGSAAASGASVAPQQPLGSGWLRAPELTGVTR
ncbi:hypothetical protein EYF80_060855 [Liparis tanakae]|uniref:Uncharacterized protein n=1 Tax=Liparis tanakae TaxID=230148 RepID=A0A4Z2EJQ5_9TELE|nr:hypothetical protein EYF80_060855 [Liparis tanakae]